MCGWEQRFHLQNQAGLFEKEQLSCFPEGSYILLRDWILSHHFADRPRFLLLPSAGVLALVTWAELDEALLTHTVGCIFPLVAVVG